MATPRICSIPDCGKRHYARGYCQKHHRRWFRYGDPDKRLQMGNGEAARFFKEVVLPYEGDECLKWPYGERGYPDVWIDGERYSVTRLVCERIHGPPPTREHQAAHSCGNGHLRCVTKAHLSWKTCLENMHDKIGHKTLRRGEKCYQAKLTGEDVRTIRALEGQVTRSRLADRFNVTIPTITDIHRRKTWAWLA